MDKRSEKRVFFLTGLPKSGTTWMMNILNSLEDVCCLGEGRFFSSGLQNVPSLYEALAKGLRPWYEFISLRKKNWLGLDAHLESINRQNFLPAQAFAEAFDRDLGQVARMTILNFMLGAVQGDPKVKMIGDKTPVMAPEELRKMANLFPDAKVVFMQRNVKDFIVSLLFHYWRATRDRRPDSLMSFMTIDDFLSVEKFVNSDEGEKPPFVGAPTALRLAKLWKSTNEEASVIAEVMPETMMVVSYEEMMRDPSQMMDRVFDFLCLAPQESIRREAIERNSKEAVKSGTNNALKAHVRSGEEGDWVHYLSPEVSMAIDDVLL
ncbi:MAG: sulfotransferase [Deltaproteobacteria bacterium]|nr:sulfotransferase [Deltaproteobacteria bacterium]